MSSCYTTVTASVVQVASAGALGAMIDNLKTRQIDIFASAYFTTRPFAHGHEREATDQPIYATRRNQIKNKFEITRSFDLIYQLFLVIDLPGIGSFDSNGVYMNEGGAFYTNGVAAALVNEIHLCMGGHSLCMLTGAQIYLYEELAGRPGKRLMESVGKSTSKEQLRTLSTTAQRLYLPMYYWFCSTRGSVSSALNLIGAQFQKATIDLSLNSLCSVVEDGENDADFISKNALEGTQVWVIDEISTDTMTAPVRRDDGDVGSTQKERLSQYTGARVTLDVLGITLNEDDRNVFSTKDRMSLMDEVTVISRTGSQALTKDEVISITDHAKNLIYELQIAARVRKARSRGKDDRTYVAQGPLRFDGRIDATTGLTSEPLGTLSLTISGQQRTQQNLEAAFYNRVTPYMHHSTLPSAKGIYSMPFSLYPEDWNVPDSYANASKLDSMRLQIGLPKEVVKTAGDNGGVDVQIFCHTFNVLVEQKGMKARFFV
jgi:hypothetical protein